MGADLLLTWVGLEEGREPDFEAARTRINELTDSELETAAREHFAWDENSGIADVATSMHAEVNKLEKLWIGGSREVARLKVRGADLLFTGGMSWGDGPTDAFEVIEKVMAIPGALEAAGFTE